MASGAGSIGSGANVGNVASRPAPTTPTPAAQTTNTAAPATATATTTLSPEAAGARVKETYDQWNASIGNGVNNSDPDAQKAARGLLSTSLQMTENDRVAHEKEGKPYDPDAGFAANMASTGAKMLLGGENPPDPNAQSTKTVAEMSSTALAYLQAREAELKAQTGGTAPPPQ